MRRKRRAFTAEFKKTVAIEAIRGTLTVRAIAAKHALGPNQVSAWKRQAVDGLEDVFAPKRPDIGRTGPRIAVERSTGTVWRRHSITSARTALAVNPAALANSIGAWERPNVKGLNESVERRRAQPGSRLNAVKRPRKTAG